jgi:hypothetical protein
MKNCRRTLKIILSIDHNHLGLAFSFIHSKCNGVFLKFLQFPLSLSLSLSLLTGVRAFLLNSQRRRNQMRQYRAPGASPNSHHDLFYMGMMREDWLTAYWLGFSYRQCKILVEVLGCRAGIDDGKKCWEFLLLILFLFNLISFHSSSFSSLNRQQQHQTTNHQVTTET